MGKTEDQKRMAKRVTLALITLPLLIALFVVGGAIVGLYLSEVSDSAYSYIFPFAFSTIGLVLSIIASYFVAHRVSRTTPDPRSLLQ